MKQITQISIQWQDEDGRGYNQNFGGGSVMPIDDLFSFLIKKGFFDDIQVTKRFSTSQEVMNRLKD